MGPRTQKQPQVKKELCRVLDNVNCNVKCIQLRDQNNFKYKIYYRRLSNNYYYNSD